MSPTKEANQILASLEAELKKEKRIVIALAYGSILGDSFHNKSDVDIAVIVEIPFSSEEQLTLQNNLSFVAKKEVDLVFLSSNTSLILQNEIATNGLVLLARNPRVLLNFQVSIPQQYLDFMYNRKILEDDYIERNLK